ncbi:MAG: 3-oxoacyl-[acyl-carrier protein] reductase [Thermoleophilaceae bacterium]|nr:3-oxoacyl-[acyl-carrier protein] reductase [Thermoleophilaceae bacterium]
MDLGLQGRVALVTAASSGIGFGIAQALAAEGATVAVSSRTRERIDPAAEKIGARPYVFDSMDLDAAPGLIDAVEADLGPLSILVTNTGGPPGGEPLEFSREQWEDAYRELVLSPMALIEHALPGMRERGFGRILSVSSSSAREPIPALLLSTAHRSALLATFKLLAGRLAGDGITLNTLLPGRFATERLLHLHGSMDAAEEAARSDVPIGRLGTVEEIGAAGAFLCSERASYITGVALPVDGGLLRAT